MVAAEDEEVFGILDLEREQQADSFQALLAAIHIVAKEEVIRLGWEPAIFEKAQEIIVLSMYVTCSEQS